MANRGSAPGHARVLTSLLAAFFASCGDPDPEAFHTGHYVPPPVLHHGQDVRFDAACAALRASADVTLYAGLPRGRSEHEAVVATQPVVVFHDQYFHAEPLAPRDEDVRALQETLSQPEGFRPRGLDEMTLCGGFHADYALTWLAPGGVCTMQLCFGCTDVDLYTPDGRVALDMDGASHADSRFRALLEACRR